MTYTASASRPFVSINREMCYSFRMIRNIAAASLGLALFAAPIVASADALSDTLDQARFLATRTAASQVNFDASKPSCKATVSTTVVGVKEKFILAWGSYGLVDTDSHKNMWAPNAAYLMVVDKPGTYTYSFTFYGVGGVAASCATTVIVK